MGRMNGLVLSLGALGFGILYLPIIIMVIFSFNAANWFRFGRVRR